MFERDDWTLFRSLSTLSQKAGVPLQNLRRLVVKELVDNALDVSGGVEFQKIGEHTYEVSDSGTGIPGDEQAIARLFSVRRPLASTKIVRLPSRGALGNGLRVVVGSVLASGNRLTVCTNGHEYLLQPKDDGSTSVIESRVWTGQGTTIRICLQGIPTDDHDLYWANLAKNLHFAKNYNGKTSPWWYDSDSFYELLMSANGREAAEIIALFEGFNIDTARSTLNASGAYVDCKCSEYDRDSADRLLEKLRETSKKINPKSLGGIGKNFDAYARNEGVLEIKPGRGKFSAELPYVIESWAFAKEGKDTYYAFVNGTPVTGDTTIRRDKASTIALFGCGLCNHFDGVSRKPFELNVNITIPYMPITTDGKEPDFRKFYAPLSETIKKATKKLKSGQKREMGSQLDNITDQIPRAVRLASGNGVYQYSIRQLYYAVRPAVLERSDKGELDYNYFCTVITKYENDNGELPGMYRDPRGNLYHPHTGESIPLGTVSVRKYERPEWTFNKVLYCEKEGLVNTLIASRWPERNDCAILSSKGFASRAARDVIDLMGESDSELIFFCIHDADASGTLIYQALQEATPARAARKVKIINLGLEPWEALEMGLQVEEFTSKSKRPVANYVKSRYDSPDDGSNAWTWENWMQTRRVELNAMTSPAFLSWLDGKMDEHDGGKRKVIPPEPILRSELTKRTEAIVRAELTRRLLEKNGIDDMVERAMDNVCIPIGIGSTVYEFFADSPDVSWTEPIASTAKELADSAL